MADRTRSRRGVLDRIAYELGVALRRTTDTVAATRRAVPRTVSWRAVERRATVRRSAAAAEPGLRSLCAALSDADPAARVHALGVVGELSADTAAGLLAGALVDPDPSVRCAAAAAAARARAHGVVFSLIIALDDPDPSVRKAAGAALADITGKDTELGDDPEQRRARIDELKQWWKQLRFEQLAARRDTEPSQ